MNPPHFSPFPGARPSCPLCSLPFDLGEPACDCVNEEDWTEECPCCRDAREERETHRRFDEYAEAEHLYDRDYDAEEQWWLSYVESYAEWCAPKWHEDTRWDEELGWYCPNEDDYTAWRLAFPERGWESWEWWERCFASAVIDRAEVMKLWLVQREGSVGYDEAQAFVIRAGTEAAARAIASRAFGAYEHPEAWLNPIATTCEVVPEQGPAEIVLADVRYG